VAKKTEVEPEDDFGARKAEYIDVIVSDVRTKNGFNFSVQILNTEGK
jgi:staphylococcal nuclease domain-containing protein 1